ncbi:hypothetical protein LOZ53_004942 [Ophidiomyces ophidiicola]|nr:hypothetical protein LOZ55_006497 [Ophidiomyces ophidiicola]KAI1980954.1 hypothetical protein LOZ54_005710 [Ophidiomyces ophidiicola]KAI1985726.1 hypothetical protein LOZ53_004942 [Ophidiomyces ophidiicola]KAI1986473.1 hypothetical protein LOZ51_006067 [Ophidiomyces ophidiicola]KAI2081046.1 hypothetical protein LOZ36_006315 [Ophidiomyces ophidiicola]
MAVRVLPSPPVRDTIRQVSESSWLVGDLLLQRFPGLDLSATWNDSAANAHYTLTDAPSPPPVSTLLPADSPVISKIYDAGDASAVFFIGHHVVLKIKCLHPSMTAEVTTLDFVRRQNRSFDVPNVIHHIDLWNGDRSIVFYERLPGRTLMAAWPTLDDHWRDYYKLKIARVCLELSQLKGDQVAGVDGKALPEYFLAKRGQTSADNFEPATVRAFCQACGMDVDDLVFYHTDLGPGNIMVEAEPKVGHIGIIDWEVAGFFPRAWIRTKFLVSSGMNLDREVAEDRQCWRLDIARLLGDLGFETCVDQWTQYKAALWLAAKHSGE